MIDDLNTIINLVRDQGAKLLLIPAQVGAVGHQNGQMIVCHMTAVVQIVHQVGDHLILPHPETGHIADYQRNPVAGLNPLIQRRCVNGRIQGSVKGGGNILNGRGVMPVQNGYVGFFQRNVNSAAAVAEGIRLHEKLRLLGGSYVYANESIIAPSMTFVDMETEPFAAFLLYLAQQERACGVSFRTPLVL